EVERVHCDPPIGHRDPAAFHALGLDRMYYFVFRKPRLDHVFVAARYSHLASVVRAWTDRLIDGSKIPNDPDWSSQWNLSSSSDLNCPPGWDRTTSATVLVSVVDTGGDLDHPDLAANIWVNPGEIPNNGKDDEGNGYVDDVNGWDFWNGDATPDDD